MSILNSLKQRMAFLVYQRTELYKIQQKGGALIRPLFTEYPYDKNMNDTWLPTVMYGSAIKVSLVLNPNVTD